MKNNIGLWIDHKKTVLVFMPDESVQTIDSELQETFSAGGTHGVIGKGAKDYPSEDIHDRHVTKLEELYYQKVALRMNKPESIFIMGPGEAKLSFAKHLEHDGYKGMIEKIETVDKMTDNQILAKVRAFYQK